MKKLLLFTSIFCFTVFANNTLLAQYSNAALNGPWFMDTIPAQIYNPDNTNYLVFDGNGNIIDGSMFCSFSGIAYSVSAGGAILGTICGFYPFTAQLTSQNYATMGSGWTLSKIANPGALTDSLVGIISNPICGQGNITLRLNNQGLIISASGLTPPVTGRVYADLGHFEGHIKTGANTEWCSCGSLDEFTIVGAYSNDSLNGVLAIDGSQGGCRNDGTVHLKRFGNATTGIIENNAKTNFTIFPNPFSSQTVLQTGNLFKDATLTVYNSFGQTVKQIDNLSGLTIIFHRDNLPSGLYFVRLTQANKILTTEKIIITD
jgi:hypothetical protein